MDNILITGGTSGLGYQSAMELSKMGYEVSITSRSLDRAESVARSIHQRTGNPVHGYALDLSDLDSVRTFSGEFPHDQIDILLNNAGALYSKRILSKQGIEMTLAGNHLGHFLLTYLLQDRIGGKRRIINVSSAAHRNQVFDFDNYNRERGYSAFKVYGESKLANLFFTYKLAEKLPDFSVNALHPGFVATNFAKNNGLLYKIGMVISRPIQKGRKKGAETQIYLCDSEKVNGISGKYFVNKQVKSSSSESMKKDNWDRMWELSEKLCDVSW